MAAIIELIAQYGIGLVCVAILLYDHLKFLDKLSLILDAISKRLTRIETKLDIEEDE